MYWKRVLQTILYSATIIINQKGFAQAPDITYDTPQVYTQGIPITPLFPVNTGGLVPPNIYGEVIKFAGTGKFGSKDAHGLLASFGHPYGIAADKAGNVYVSEPGNYLLRKITPDGDVTTLAGGGPGTNGEGMPPQNGQGAMASFAGPFGAGIDKDGNIYIADPGGNQGAIGLIRKVTPGGFVTTLAGSGAPGHHDAIGKLATFDAPFGIALDAEGNAYVADLDQRIRKITPAGVVTTFAGDGEQGAVDGVGTAARFKLPSGIEIDKKGTIYVADEGNNKIRKITSGALVSTFAGSGATGSDNGTSLVATFNAPSDIAIDLSGNVFVADAGNNMIRKISSNGVVTTLAGNGSIGANDGVGDKASFDNPKGLALDDFGNLYVADYVNDLIRKITLTGYTISTTLPAGLIFDPRTGKITGTPTVLSPPVTYTITGYNAEGSSSFDVVISVIKPIVPPETPVAYIPNTFTPNGDGVNDTWHIGDYANLPGCIVNIYNRYGTLLFHSVGYPEAWDGTYNGKQLPVGAYYYIIDPQNGAKEVAGWVSIVR